MNTIESPCVSVCIINPETQFCKGCWRTKEEIARWAESDDDARLDILKRLHMRRDEAMGTTRKRARRRPSRK